MGTEYDRTLADLNKALPDPGVAGSVAGLLQGIKASPIILTGVCDTGMTASTVTIVSDDLEGYGNDYFNNNWYVMVVKNANSIGAAPSGETREITDYVSATGTFTCTAFSANVEASDEIVLIHGTISGWKSQKYTTGSGNWTCPAGVTRVDVLIVSGGGGGGGSLDNGAAGGGGGGGAVGLYTDIPVTPGTAYAYVVGAGGAGGAAGDNDGSNGGSSSFRGKTLTGGLYGSKCSVRTGGAGAACETLTGGEGGTAGTAAPAGSGGNGTNATTFSCATSGAGGGGGSTETQYAGSGGATIFAVASVANKAGGGGGGSLGAGAVGPEFGDNNPGNDAAANTGGGGSGGFRLNANVAGGNGGSGYILIMWK